MTVNPEREVMIACNTLKTEIEYVAAQHGLHRRTIWLESQLHNVPENLSSALQEAIDSVQDADRVLLGFANCGNVVQGLKSGNFELIVARLDDCVSLVMGSQARRTAYGEQWHSLFFTDGWMDKGHNIIEEFNNTVDAYGEDMAQEVFDMMYAHYETMTYIDTGLYDPALLMERTQFIADMCNMQQRVEPGTLAYVEELVCGPWDESRFVHVAPGETIPAAPFMVPGEVPI